MTEDELQDFLMKSLPPDSASADLVAVVFNDLIEKMTAEDLEDFRTEVIRRYSSNPQHVSLVELIEGEIAVRRLAP